MPADDFKAGRGQALMSAQLIEVTSRLTDATITLFCRLIALLFTKSNARQDRPHLDARKEMGRLLRMFGDTLRVLAEVSETGEDTSNVLDREIGWHRLVQARADVEALATPPRPVCCSAPPTAILGPPLCACAARCLHLRSARAHDPLLTAIDLLRQFNRDDRRGLLAMVPLGALIQKARKPIAANGKRDRRLWRSPPSPFCANACARAMPGSRAAGPFAPWRPNSCRARPRHARERAICGSASHAARTAGSPKRSRNWTSR